MIENDNLYRLKRLKALLLRLFISIKRFYKEHNLSHKRFKYLSVFYVRMNVINKKV